jgi:transcriptional regulator with XRE-family HTH domain
MAPVYITIDPEATGRNIRVLMAQNGYDIDDVREACGNVSPQAVYKWLSGKSLPSIDNLKILSVIFGTTMEGILVTDENAHVFFLPFFLLFFFYFPGVSCSLPAPDSFPLFYFSDLTRRPSSSSQSERSE